jgi:hypothetical protein
LFGVVVVYCPVKVQVLGDIASPCHNFGAGSSFGGCE